MRLRQLLISSLIRANVPKKRVNDKDRWSLFNEEDGIMDLKPTALAVDSSGHVWAAHAGGLSHFTLRKWEQVKFENNNINDISVDGKGAIWIATDKGVWRHLPDYATASGRKAELERGTCTPSSHPRMTLPPPSVKPKG